MPAGLLTLRPFRLTPSHERAEASSQWQHMSAELIKPLPSQPDHLITAAGPSRNSTGVPCSPVKVNHFTGRRAFERQSTPGPQAVNERGAFPEDRRSQADHRDTLTGKLPVVGSGRGQTLPVEANAAIDSAGYLARPHTTVAVAAAGISCLTERPKSLGKKNLEPTQACFPRPPIAPLSPGASLCPSGNQKGAAVT